MLDENDRKVLKQLQIDCSRTKTAIAEAIELPLTTYNDRLDKLLKGEFIKRFKAELDPIKLGYVTTVFVFVNFKNDMKSSIEKLRHLVGNGRSDEKLDEDTKQALDAVSIIDVYGIFGPIDAIIKIRGRNPEEVQEAVGAIAKFADVTTQTFHVGETVAENADLKA